MKPTPHFLASLERLSAPLTASGVEGNKCRSGLWRRRANLIDLLIRLRKERSAKSKDETQFILESMKKYGSIEQGKRKAREFATESKRILDNCISPYFKSSSAANSISQLVDFVINREY